MTTTTKALLIIIAIAAFGIGVTAKSVRDKNQIDTGSLLAAELMISVAAPDTGSPVTGSIKQQLGALTLVNFWASWCTPCRKEMPIFEAMYLGARQQGFQVIGVAIDNPDKTRAMLDSMGITYPILYAEQTGMELMSAVGNPQGLLPYSLLLDERGEVLEQVLGRIHEQDIAAWLTKYL